MNYLDKIAAYKKEEIKGIKAFAKERPPSTKFKEALRQPHLTVIGEVKRRSPSRGELKAFQDPVEQAQLYRGATALSVLTDTKSFGGSLEDMQAVSQALPLPVLRKDFIIDPVQLAESALHGATAVLLIVRLLKKELKYFLSEATRLGLETLTEIHDREELDIALEAHAPIIGINHRNLNTFQVDLNLSDALRPLIPPSVITVAESGIQTPEDAARMRALNYDAILVGEALVKADDPAELIAKMKGYES